MLPFLHHRPYHRPPWLTTSTGWNPGSIDQANDHIEPCGTNHSSRDRDSSHCRKHCSISKKRIHKLLYSSPPPSFESFRSFSVSREPRILLRPIRELQKSRQWMWTRTVGVVVWCVHPQRNATQRSNAATPPGPCSIQSCS